MRILYVSTADGRGGAAIGAYRLHAGFVKKGIQSELLVARKYTDDPTVKKIPFNPIVSRLKLLCSRKLIKLQKSTNSVVHSINLFPSILLNEINESDADIVILHWIGNELLSIAQVGRINKPIIWRMADQWVFSGAEHYVDSKDNRCIEGYHAKNRPQDHRGIDIDRWTWNRKKRHWPDKNIHFVAGSNWLKKCAEKSNLLKASSISVIHSALDIDVYKPIEKFTARKILNLPLDSDIILFGSMLAVKDVRKGFQFLAPAFNALTKKIDFPVSAAIFGASNSKINSEFPFPINYLSHLQDDWSLVLAYSAADVFLLPTMADNLPFTAIEALACGTPTVSFDVGGLSDIVDHKINGYLSKPYSTDDLSAGIEFVLKESKNNSRLSMAARQKTVDSFSIDLQVDQYLKLINTILSR